jgi:hypothetical protein
MKWKTENIVLIILASAVAYTIIMYITGMFVLNQPTTEVNIQLRRDIIGMVNNIQVSIVTIIMYKLGERKNL